MAQEVEVAEQEELRVPNGADAGRHRAFRHIDAVVNDLGRRCMRLHSLTLHGRPGSLHVSAPIPTLRALDVGGMELALDGGPSTAIAELECQGVALSHIAPSASLLRLQYVRCSRGVLLECSNHLW
jgi:hypothetical protein